MIPPMEARGLGHVNRLSEAMFTAVTCEHALPPQDYRGRNALTDRGPGGSTQTAIPAEKEMAVWVLRQPFSEKYRALP
jgi:hypothetical protein